MENISVKKMVAIPLLLLLGMIVLLGGMGMMAEREAAQVLTEINQISAQQASAANRAETNLMEVRVRLERMVQHYRSDRPERAQVALEEALQALSRSDARIDSLANVTLPEGSERRVLIDNIVDGYQHVVSDALRGDLDSARFDAIERQLDPINQRFVAFSEAIDTFNRYALERGSRVHADSVRDGQVLLATVAVLIVVAVGLYLVMQRLLNRLLVSPLQRAVQVCENIAKGDLTSDIDAKGHNEMGRLYAAMANMQERLEEMIGTLHQSSEAVASSSQQIASGSQDLASRTEQQAAALQQTAASMDEISSIVRQNAETASQAERLTQEASRKAENGQQTSHQNSQLMHGLEESSKRINEIIQVIDSIAFQTNILALNASVEAARAGEHGRGFAVVASEVRSLATRTSNSSKEIRHMIEDISQRIIEGANQAQQNGKSMDDINQAVIKVNDMMQALALAAKEQETGIDQISTAVTEMDSATQENVSLVEETSTASASLQHEASSLAELVATFRLARAQHSAPTRSNASVAPRLQQPDASVTGAKHAPSRTTPEWDTF
ncbi:HAMP domain-containing protein [Halomonas sp. ML-15]|uniref:methyl-accepting chemotaxis protein n=1 Tax=Halomonas sp. ML-15 TaxID=2773305 RepID=UPI0017478BB1|nr:methyl-accepting chemotaxis protein [Halomonas sp. ML-15]MBD3895257.1 HAMP domain-containing protein [Halomonas sp. ML-15]